MQMAWSPRDVCRPKDQLARPGREVAAGPTLLCVVSRRSASRGVLTRTRLRAPGTAEGVPASRGVSPAPSTEKAAGRTSSKGQMAGESRYGEMSLEWPVISWFTGTNTEYLHSDISSEVTRAWGPQDRNGGAPGARSHE